MEHPHYVAYLAAVRLLDSEALHFLEPLHRLGERPMERQVRDVLHVVPVVTPDPQSHRRAFEEV